MPTPSPNRALRLAKHADYQRAYKASVRKQHARQMSYFFALRTPPGPDAPPHVLRAAEYQGPRIGLTVPKALGKAHDRNRIKRRLRELLRRHAHLIPHAADVILHPRRTVLDLPAAELEREVVSVFRAVDKGLSRVRKPITSAEPHAPPAASAQ